MGPYTCLACGVLFDDADLQRSHYRTDWHRYNLKRKVAELPPVTKEQFVEKVQVQAQKKEEKLQDKTKFCSPCNKSFSSVNAYENHLKSKRHKDVNSKSNDDIKSKEKEYAETSGKRAKRNSNIKITPKPGYIPPVNDDEVEDDNSDEWEDVDDDEEESSDEDNELDEESEALLQTFCLFCPHRSVSVVDNFRHMTKSHSFFIPDLQFVTDLEAFFVYLGAKVGDGKVCLCCNNHSKAFQTVRACQSHMVDKGHCTLAYEGDAMLEYADFYDFSSTYPDNEDATDLDSELSSNDNDLRVDPDTMELRLPSGARAGHRALRKYYKQNIPEKQAEFKSRRMITYNPRQCLALGLNERTLSIALRKKIAAKKFENKRRAYHSIKINIKANKLQKYYRQEEMNCG